MDGFILLFFFLCRFSQLVGVKLIEGNFNIVDLSDKNCLINLVEYFLEFYDNEWMDVLEELIDMESKFEEEGIKIFFDIVKVMILSFF